MMETPFTEQARHIVELLAKGQFDQVEERLAEAVKPFLPPEVLKAGWQGLEARFGVFQRVVEAKTVQTSLAQVEAVTCAFAQASVEVNLMSPSKHIPISLTSSSSPPNPVKKPAQLLTPSLATS